MSPTVRMVTGGRRLPNATDRILRDVSSDCVLYEGRAESQDALTSEAVWLISRTTWDGSVFDTKWALSAEFSAVWDDRATYFDAPGACSKPIPYDYIKLSNGTYFANVRSDGSLDVNVLGGSISSGENETVRQVTLTLADTEYSYTFPANTKAYELALQSRKPFRYSPHLGGVNTTDFRSVFGALSYTNVAPIATRTIYFRTSTPGQIMEISSWS